MSKPSPRAVGRYDRRQTTGRYDLDGANLPPNGVAPPRRDTRNVPIAHGAVPDPYNARTRLVVSINRRSNVLEEELAHGRISVAAYNEGCIAAAIFEKAARIGAGSNWEGGNGCDAWAAKEVAIVRGLETARSLVAYASYLVGRLGPIDARILQEALTGSSFREIAHKRDQLAGERRISYYAQRFRDALEHLARSRAARGKERPHHDDKHSERAAGLADPGLPSA